MGLLARLPPRARLRAPPRSTAVLSGTMSSPTAPRATRPTTLAWALGLVVVAVALVLLAGASRFVFHASFVPPTPLHWREGLVTGQVAFVLGVTNRRVH